MLMYNAIRFLSINNNQAKISQTYDNYVREEDYKQLKEQKKLN